MALIIKEQDKCRIKHNLFSYQCPVTETGQHKEQLSNLSCYVNWVIHFTTAKNVLGCSGFSSPHTCYLDTYFLVNNASKNYRPSPDPLFAQQDKFLP